MSSSDEPIGVFDSGVGGISVLREMIALMPHENFIYFGDSENAPYGVRPEEEIRELTLNHVAHLLKEGAKGICVACNTATSAAVRVMRGMYPKLPLVGLEPAIKPAALSMEHPSVLVMATPATIRQEKLQHLLKRYEDQAHIIPLACPGLMEYVERGMLEGDEIEAFLRDLLSPYLNQKIDCIVLGCTHYPFLRKDIEKICGTQIRIFDGGEGAARQMKRLLDEKGLLSDRSEKGRVTFENSRMSREKLALCQMLLKY